LRTRKRSGSRSGCKWFHGRIHDEQEAGLAAWNRPVGSSLLGPDADKIMGLSRCAPEKSKIISAPAQI